MSNMNNGYIPVKVLVGVYCTKCGYLISAVDLIICRTETEVIMRAEREHQQGVLSKKIVCLQPQLLITANDALLSEVVFKAMEKNEQNNKPGSTVL